ncbi:hypothetical protein BDV28DRAFT_145587 [Aspergillus coremiiformis]|uniref:Uncharacterized protein n=1 Tax=Aspergillus coremiiformis TaxID=138285 RepID=A0A5N6ZFC0_9EURO|nr:hypothetical protein BDV28DRAFT_145587 [Aspergillus coremiiformis]
MVVNVGKEGFRTEEIPQINKLREICTKLKIGKMVVNQKDSPYHYRGATIQDLKLMRETAEKNAYARIGLRVPSLLHRLNANYNALVTPSSPFADQHAVDIKPGSLSAGGTALLVTSQPDRIIHSS